MRSWYLIHTKPRQEYLARENLERQGFDTYLPLSKVRRKKRGKIIRSIEAMFPRYLFIHLNDETDDWGPIRSTKGVTGLVRFGQIPAKIPQSLIDTLHSREDEQGVQILNIPDFETGGKVRIVEGPMAGYEGIFQTYSGKERVTILLQIAQRAVQVSLGASQIESN